MENEPEQPPLNWPQQPPRNQPAQPPLNHLEEYKVVHDEITMYQSEMHRTWLWAIIPAGAVYTWLALHTSELGTIPGPVWFIPTGFLTICAARYWVFNSRIKALVEYCLELETDAFGNEKQNLQGIAHFNDKRFLPKQTTPPKGFKWLFSPKRFVVGAGFIWAGLFLCSLRLSVTLSHTNGTLSKSPPSVTLPQAHEKAVAALGAQTNGSYCVSADARSVSDSSGRIAWHLMFYDIDGQLSEVIVPTSGKVIVRPKRRDSH
jgi:hypothetical protein